MELATTSFFRGMRSLTMTSSNIPVPSPFTETYFSIAYIDWPTPTIAAS